MKNITYKFLTIHGSTFEHFNFYKNNFPLSLFPDGLDLDNVEITGDYNNFFANINAQFRPGFIEYDEFGNISKKIYLSGRVYRYCYDDKNYLCKVIYPNDLIKEWINIYNDNGCLIKREYKNGCLSYIYEYDNKYNLNKVIFNGKCISEYIYDLETNKIIEEIFCNRTGKKYEYDSCGNIKSKIYQNGDVVQYEYDDKRNIIKTISSIGNVFNYDYIYDDIGRLTSVKTNINNYNYFCKIKY